jgi:hypothetical protein
MSSRETIVYTFNGTHTSSSQEYIKIAIHNSDAFEIKNCPNLKTLEILYDPPIPDDENTAPTLWIENCVKLTKVILRMPCIEQHRRNVSIIGCPSFSVFQFEKKDLMDTVASKFENKDISNNGALVLIVEGTKESQYINSLTAIIHAQKSLTLRDCTVRRRGNDDEKVYEIIKVGGNRDTTAFVSDDEDSDTEYTFIKNLKETFFGTT